MSVTTSPEDALVSIYRQGYSHLLSRLAKLEARGRATRYERELLRETEQILNEIDDQAKQWIEQELPRIYQGGQQEAIRQLAAQGVDTSGMTARITGVHRSAVQTVADNMFADLRAAERLIGRQVQDSFRQAGLEMAARGLSAGETMPQRAAHLRRIISERGLPAFVDRRGRAWTLDSYAAMVARTTTREATNLGTFNQLEENGYDLVQMSTHYPTCDICAPYQGRVYSRSGEDTRFPALYQTALTTGYETLHPNCRHVFAPWVDELATDAERREAMERSNKPFQDTRSKRERDAYTAEQARVRRARDTRRMYDRYSTIMPDDTPPLSTFSRMRNADSAGWHELQLKYREARAATRPPAWKPAMSRADADAFAQAGQYRNPVYHVTKQDNVASLKERGFDLDRKAFGRVWGDGVYVATDEATATFYQQRMVNSTRLEMRIKSDRMLRVDMSEVLDDRTRFGSGHELIASKVSPDARDQYNALLRQHSQVNAQNDEIVRAARDKVTPADWRGADRLDDPIVQARRAAGEEARSHLRYIEDPNSEALRQVLEGSGYDAVEVVDSAFTLDDPDRPTRAIGGNQIVVFDPKRVVIVDE